MRCEGEKLFFLMKKCIVPSFCLQTHPPSLDLKVGVQYLLHKRRGEENCWRIRERRTHWNSHLPGLEDRDIWSILPTCLSSTQSLSCDNNKKAI